MSKIKQPNRVREFIKWIPNQLDHLSYSDLKTICNQNLPSIPVPIIEFNNRDFNFNQREGGGLNLVYRAREITDPSNRPFKKVNCISYIPEHKKHKIKDFGRVNKPEESMFYGALDHVTASTEAITKGEKLITNKSSMVTVGVWKIDKPLNLVEIPHSEKYFKKFYEEANYESETIQLKHIQEANSEQRKKIDSDIEFEILEFFADEFAKFDINSRSEHKLSNYYADRVFNRIQNFELPFNVDGIIYPSIALSYQHENIVLKPTVIDNKLTFLNAMQLWITFSSLKEEVQFIPIEQGVNADSSGNILWS